ncbi:hypothetical protein AX15_004317 [Amanita polypyramis BW_CC]|nr:hypothetical protein AX15_004317 [Amanita polypyramis BW_CC]
MNSYPPELLVQLAPVMFVAGLEDPSAAKPQDSFSVLNQRLREALASQRKQAVWQSEQTKTFQVVIVDKNVHFPPRKVVAPDDPRYPSSHSPLSPLTPSSPLHPDGLIAPIWIKKHTTLVPSVFVLFLRMYETPPREQPSPLNAPDIEREREREQEEKRHDAELAAEIAQRKKTTNDRGIKLTVVLMASRRMLDDPTLDPRLTFIRRQSGLDSRAALFVLSPVSASELGEFISSLQQALYEPAIDYYTAHSKRVRRKRNRHSQTVTSYTLPTTSTNIARPLRPEGWTVRYEYKMGCFAEFRGENDVALKHYQDAYETLVIMFGSTIILPPRTKRWAEAKVLSDCINLKIAKLYLYNNEHALALSHHSMHMRKFGDFSRGWGIGEETFEYWSWIARQYRAFAELLEQGSYSTLKIPLHKPPTLTGNASLLAAVIRGSSASSIELDALRTLGLNPNHTLQHPGFYYYMAARCTEMRRDKFQAAVEAELKQQPILSPSFTNEKKVQHYAITLEFYTKAYELFKKYTPSIAPNQPQSRLTLWIAYRIAQTYYDSGEFAMAVRFFERIAKTYRREKWNDMLRPLLSTWYSCAQRLGEVELSVKLLLEMMGLGTDAPQDPASLEEDLVLVLKSTVPSSPGEILTVDLSESEPIFDSNVVFWKSEAEVGELSPFQISLVAPTTATLSHIPFSSLEVYFSEDHNPITIKHASSGDVGSLKEAVRTIDLGDVSHYRKTLVEHEADLSWERGNTLILYGAVKSEIPTLLKVERLVLTINRNERKIRIPMEPCSVRGGSKPIAKWLRTIDPPRFVPMKRDECSSVIVKHRPHKVLLSLSHQSPAYLDEEYPIEINVTNEDARELDITVDILLLPSEYDDSVNSIILDNERSTSLIKGISFGVLQPGANNVKTLFLINTGVSGERALDISVRSRPPIDQEVRVEEGPDGSRDGLEYDSTEILHTLAVSAVEPFKISHDVVYRRSYQEWPGLAGLKSFDSNFWDERGGEAVVNVRVECPGPWPIEVEDVALKREHGPFAKIIDSALESETDTFPSEFIPGDDFNDVCRISLAYSESEFDQESIPGPGRYTIRWRRITSENQKGVPVTTTFYLPVLRLPSDGLIALLKVSSVATLHVPMPLVLLVRNYHKSKSANITVHLEADSQDGFVVAGLRNGRIPILLPGTEEKVVWHLIPLECGHLKVPNIRVVDRRQTLPQPSGGETHTEGEVVRVVDVRADQRRITTSDTGDIHVEECDKDSTILVLPQ